MTPTVSLNLHIQHRGCVQLTPSAARYGRIMFRLLRVYAVRCFLKWFHATRKQFAPHAKTAEIILAALMICLPFIIVDYQQYKTVADTKGGVVFLLRMPLLTMNIFVVYVY
jgi:hypothetical protein